MLCCLGISSAKYFSSLLLSSPFYRTRTGLQFNQVLCHFVESMAFPSFSISLLVISVWDIKMAFTVPILLSDHNHLSNLLRSLGLFLHLFFFWALMRMTLNVLFTLVWSFPSIHFIIVAASTHYPIPKLLLHFQMFIIATLYSELPVSYCSPSCAAVTEYMRSGNF